MAETTNSTPASTIWAAHEALDDALSEAQIITDIIGQLADAAISSTTPISASLVDWLVVELKGRLERVELADQTVRRLAA